LRCQDYTIISSITYSPDNTAFLHQVVKRFYGNPSATVRTIGITGTNGKTTVTYLIESILNEDKKKCGVVGTVSYRRDNSIILATQTTPDFVDNQQFLSHLAKENIPYCVIEVSSHALTQERVMGINFCTAVFTNLTSDHLDYHKTKNDYFSAKAKLFTPLQSSSSAVINADDLYGRQLFSMTKAKILSYGISRQADVMAKDIQLNISGSSLVITYRNDEIAVNSKLIGIYNVYNILASVSACLCEGLSLNVIKRGVESLANIPGRLESVVLGQDFSIFIDYAHTQDALENVLGAIRQTSKAKIILVFGCGGDRDKSKRRLMGQIAGQLADISIVTSDNPRSEDAQLIIDQIIEGFGNDHYETIVNRKEAIERALKMAQTGDIVLIVGKGHETYQVFADCRIDFNERDIIEKCLV